MTRNQKAGKILMGLGALLILSALLLFAYNQAEEQRAADCLAEILPKLKAEIEAEAVQFPEEMKEVEIDGYNYIGTVLIPDLDLELPVMSEWDSDRLKIAPCRYMGSVLSDDLIIAAHNYAHHFKYLSNLNAGDLVYFLDMRGILYTYEVVEIEELAPNAIEEMISSGYDLTLFTCTYAGRSRITVRCSRVIE